MLEFDPEEEQSFPHKRTTEGIIGAAFEVYRQLGYGFLERVYERAMQVELLGKIGLLLNFGRTKVEFRRLVF